MPVLNASQIRDVAAQAGFRGEALRISVAVALAESGGRTDVYNGICCWGLWQINAEVHKRYSTSQLKVPIINAKEAFRISGGGKNWQPWEAYTNGAYKKHMDDPGISKPSDIPLGGTIGETIGGTATAIQNLAATVRRFVAGLTDAGTWIRVGMAILGVVLLIVGVSFIASDIGLSSSGATKLIKNLPI